MNESDIKNKYRYREMNVNIKWQNLNGKDLKLTKKDIETALSEYFSERFLVFNIPKNNYDHSEINVECSECGKEFNTINDTERFFHTNLKDEIVNILICPKCKEGKFCVFITEKKS